MILIVSVLARLRRIIRQSWRDLLSVYYANTPVWRWLKSAALVFLGFFAWTGGAVLLSVSPGWTVLHYVMAYGFLLVIWGPFTHFVVVPFTIRLRRTADHPIARKASRNSGKINLTIFFTLVLIFGTFTPGVMMLEFGFSLPGDGSADVSGELVCEFDAEPISCQIANHGGFDSVEVTSGDRTVATADEPPYAFEIDREELAETRRGKEFRVHLLDEDGDVLRQFVRTVN